ncbi:peptidase T [Peptoniphilaceae bacterium SGI.131]
MEKINLKERLKERFFRYLSVESQSNSESLEVPSSSGQWDMAKLLKAELEDLGLKDINLNEHGVLQAYLPSRLRKGRKADAIGWVCHMDTVDVGLSPFIHPIVVENYQGDIIWQNREKNIFICPKDHPELLAYKDQDIVVSDGSSVLGADNKAAIANIMTVMDILKDNQDIEHGDIYLAFVPDEEIGLRGARHIDFDKFPVDYAYTIDACGLGEVVFETFNAGSAEINIRGISAHPMSSKNQLVNPLLVGVDFINLLDRAKMPEHTEGREGYIWVTNMESDVLNCRIRMNIRDHDKLLYEEKKTYIKKAFDMVRLKHPKAVMELEIKDVYSNIMDSLNEENKKAVDNLYRALDELDIEVKTLAMRGGTDGSYISSRGIITPNYFTGAHNFHSYCEFLPMESFEKSCMTSLKLIELAVRDAI